MWMLLIAAVAAVETVVTDVDALRAAIAAANPGDMVVLRGTVRLDTTLLLSVAGTAEAPITLRGDGGVIISNTVEALKITAPYWHIEKLRLEGDCARDDDCEHALHIVGAADGTRVTENVLVDFNAQIKGNGEEIDGAYAWPDDVIVAGNQLYDTRPRVTANPVTKIDVVGGQRWQLLANRISDFQKDGGDTVSYAAFLKGNSKDGRIERNLVVCSERFDGGVRVGLSLGGGGTSPDSICEDGSCSPEHQRGRIQNNLIVHCNDVGIYLNKANTTSILHNTLYDTAGVDVRYVESTATLAGNLLDDDIRERDGGTATEGALNLTDTNLDALFSDPGALDFSLTRPEALVDLGTADVALVDDYCGAARDALPDLGAIEYVETLPCDTTRTWWTPDAEGPTDSGSSDSGGSDGDPSDSGAPDGDPSDSAPSDPTDSAAAKSSGCGCGTHTPLSWSMALLVGVLWSRRR